MHLAKKIVLAGLIVAGALAYAGDKHLRAPLPDKLFAAKNVYIENRTGFQEAADHCYEALKKWGRFTVVNDKAQADLVFVLTGGHENAGAVAIPSGSSVLVTDVRRSITALLVVDAASGDTLWQDTMHAPHGSRAGSLVDELRKRLEERSGQNVPK
jgi:hypothetical protein